MPKSSWGAKKHILLFWNFFVLGHLQKKKRHFVEKIPILGEGGGGGLPTWELFPHNTVFGSEDVPYPLMRELETLQIDWLAERGYPILPLPGFALYSDPGVYCPLLWLHLNHPQPITTQLYVVLTACQFLQLFNGQIIAQLPRSIQRRLDFIFSVL